MKISKRIISLIIVVISLFTTTAITANATATTAHKVANYDAVSGGKISSCQVNYKIKGNALSEKKITIKPCKNTADFELVGWGKINKSTAYSFYLHNAYFNYKIFDTNGKLLRQGQHRFNESFKLPKGSKNYTVEIWSYYQSYNYNNTNHEVAAYVGTYKLSY